MILQIFRARVSERDEVLCEDIYETSVNSTVSCNDTVAEECGLLHSEVGAAVGDEHVEFFKAAFVEEHCDPFAGSVFALLVLRVDSLLATAETGLLTKLYQRFYLFKLLAHNLIFRLFN